MKRKKKYVGSNAMLGKYYFCLERISFIVSLWEKNIVFVYNKQLLTRVKHQRFRRCFIGIGIAKNLEENPEVETSFPVWNLSTPHEAKTCIKANMMDIVLYIVLSCNRLSDFSKGKGHFCRCSRQLIMYSWSSVCGVC